MLKGLGCSLLFGEDLLSPLYMYLSVFSLLIIKFLFQLKKKEQKKDLRVIKTKFANTKKVFEKIFPDDYSYSIIIFLNIIGYRRIG